MELVFPFTNFTKLMMSLSYLYLLCWTFVHPRVMAIIFFTWLVVYGGNEVVFLIHRSFMWSKISTRIQVPYRIVDCQSECHHSACVLVWCIRWRDTNIFECNVLLMSSHCNISNHSWEGPLAPNGNVWWDYGACTSGLSGLPHDVILEIATGVCWMVLPL